MPFKTMHITGCLAVSIDGKISPPSQGDFIRMGTDDDIKHLKKLRDEADAIIFGASTFRAYSKTRTSLNNKKPLIHCILTRSLDLPLDAPLFTESPSAPVLIFTPNEAPEALKAQYPAHVEWYALDAETPAQSVLEVLAAKGIKRSQVEGGGEIVPMFLNEQLLDDIHLTLCPLFIGHQPGVPGLITQPLNIPIRAKLLKAEPLKDEIYLHYACQYDNASRSKKGEKATANAGI